MSSESKKGGKYDRMLLELMRSASKEGWFTLGLYDSGMTVREICLLAQHLVKNIGIEEPKWVRDGLSLLEGDDENQDDRDP